MRTKQRTFTWEGRCYESKFGNMDLLNITLHVTDESIEKIVDEIRERVNIMHTEEPWSDHDEDEGTTTYFMTVVIEEGIKDVVFACLKEKGFREI